MTHLRGHFTDQAVFDPTTKTARSVRDGVLFYSGAELNREPMDRMYSVYRSPATIANAAAAMRGIPVTDEHVSLDLPAPAGGGVVTGGRMDDFFDATTSSTVAVLSTVAVSDTLLAAIEAGKAELSLGYTADLVEHSEYDFEQRDIAPHHLAVVPQGRCGSSCRFIDHKPTEEAEPMARKLHKAFTDAEGALSLQQIVELATALPEAIKSVPVDQLTELLPALEQIVEAAKGVMPAPEEPGEEPETPVTDEEPEKEDMPTADENPDDEDEKKKFSDAVAVQAKKFTDAAVKSHTEAIVKARNFLDADYDFVGKTTAQIQRDAIATQTDTKFSDAELAVAFKMLQKADSKYKQFGDAATDQFNQLAEKEM